VVLWRLRYKLSLRDLAEMFLIRGLVFSYEAVRDWEAKLTRHWLRTSVGDEKAKSAEAGTLTRHTFGRVVVGGICIARSVALAPWLT
jgi:hypothetical protein